MKTILIAGAGPAGLASALAIRKELPDVSVSVVERSKPYGFRPGETVPGRILQLFQHLELKSSFLKEEHWPEYGKRVLWGGLSDAPSLLYASDHGWHLCRPQFDEWLEHHCRHRGIQVIRDFGKAHAVHRGDYWMVTGRSITVRADFLVNATGSPVWLADYLQPGKPKDHLMATYCFGDKIGEETYTTIAAARNGWWYHCNLADRAVFTFVTDPTHAKQLAKHDARQLQDELPDDAHLQEAFSTVPGDQQPNWFSIRVHKSVAHGPDCLAVGDALMKFDPLSGQGIYKAFETAIWSSYALRDQLAGDPQAMKKYALIASSMFASYEQHRDAFYGTLQDKGGFWARRGLTSTSISGGSALNLSAPKHDHMKP